MLVQKFGPVIPGNVTVCKKLTFDNREHDTNAFIAILVTDKGIVMKVSLQLLNAFSPIKVTVLGIVYDVLTFPKGY